MSVYHVNNLAGGMNEVIHPMLLQENQAALLVDANIENGKIRAIKQPEDLGFSSPQDLLHFGNRNRSVIKWYDRYYWSDNSANSYGGNIEDLGVRYPASPPLIVPQRSSQGLTGKYKYCITYVNKNGWESAPGDALNYYTEVQLYGQTANVAIPDFPKSIKYVKIYRTLDNGADFYYIGESSKRKDSFADTMDDITASMQNVLDTFDDYPPPEQGKYLTEAGGVFFLAVGSNLYFTKQDNPHAWPRLNFIGIGDIITGICPEFQGVLVFTQNNTYRIIGAENIETVTKIEIPGNQGCINYRTIAQLANLPIWLSNDGICIWDGSNISIVSMKIIDTYKLAVKYAVSGNDVYYLFCDDGAICYDRRSGGIFYRLSITCDYAWYDGNTDSIYLQKDNSIYSYGTGKTETYVYVSPDIGGNDLTYKQFKEIMISSRGDFNIEVKADGEKIFDVDVKNSGRHRIKMPYPTTVRSVNIKITGNTGFDEMSVFYD